MRYKSYVRNKKAIAGDRVRSFRRTVLTYWKQNGRHELPWRKTRDPYAILVSEIMLQQTQVERVIPYFTRWMQMFPTAQALARASLPVVLKCWSGLGYNRRAKHLHEAAMRIAQYGMPREYAALRELPGVGDYTAKAVRVFAFGEPETLIETNVRSVFIHSFFPRARAVSDERLLPLIDAALDRRDPRRWYSALMDYGSFLKATTKNPSRRSRHHTRQSTFKGSLREVRGAILKASVDESDLKSVRAEFPDRFDRAYEALVREGLIGGISGQK